MVEHTLESLGFTGEEVRTYLHLLQHGPRTAGAMAKTMGMPRPSLYGFLKRLLDRGLITQSQQEGVKTFAATPPEKINLLFEQRIAQLNESRRHFEELLPQLRKQTAKLLTPKFQLSEGEAGLKHVLKDMLLYRDIATAAFWPIKAMVDILSPEFFRYHNRERIRRRISTRAIWPASQVVDMKTHPYLGVGKAFLREIRVAPKDIDFSMGYWTYGTKAAFIASRKESVGFLIESAELVEMLLAQFEVVWKLSTRLEVKPEDMAPFLQELERTI